MRERAGERERETERERREAKRESEGVRESWRGQRRAIEGEIDREGPEGRMEASPGRQAEKQSTSGRERL